MSNVVVRKNPMSNNEVVLLAPEGATLEQMYERILEDSNLKRGPEFDQYFKVYVNGHEIYRKYWKHSRPRIGTKVLFAIVPKGDDALNRQILVTVAVAAAVYFTPASYAPLAKFAIAAGTAIGANLLANALIPPVSNALSYGGYQSESYGDSQMYAISGQSNNLKKYNTVPKVYGSHRFFPNIAANFYTSIETDSETKELAQFFYAIYDFGLGPANRS